MVERVVPVVIVAVRPVPSGVHITPPPGVPVRSETGVVVIEGIIPPEIPVIGIIPARIIVTVIAAETAPPQADTPAISHPVWTKTVLVVYIVVGIDVETAYPRAVSVRVVTVILTVTDPDPHRTSIKFCRRNLHTYTLRLFVEQCLLLIFVFDVFEAIAQPARCVCGHNRVTATQQYEQ